MLGHTVDMDRLLAQLGRTPKTSTARTAREALQAILDLKQTLENVRHRGS